jgi:GDP-L-fucose synthase
MVGYHLVPMLQDAGAQVIVVTNRDRPEALIDGIYYSLTDAGNPDEMLHALGQYYPDVLINLAASVSGIFYNLSNQATQLWQNLCLQFIPLLAAREACIPIFLQVSTVCIYDPKYNVLIEERGFDGQPTTGYAWAKRMGEKGVHYLTSEYEGRIVIVRPANMYGENDNFGTKVHVIPSLIKQFLDPSVEHILLFASGLQTREFLHAEDAAKGIMAAVEKGEHGKAYNLGTDGKTNVTILRLAEMIRSILGVEKEIIPDPSREPLDWSRIVIADKAYYDLGWYYRIGLDEGLQRTIDWFNTSKARRGIDVPE